MKFDFLVSNPPYQDDTPSGNKNYSPPLYDKFMEAAHHAAEKVVLITPTRFLFNAGATPKDFNQRMLNDPHLKVLHYEQDASKFFRNVDIEGGVAITLHDATKNFGAIGTFTPFEELNSIHQKVCVDNKSFQPLSEIVFGRTNYRLSKIFIADNPDAPFLERQNDFLKTNAFVYAADYFFDEKPTDGQAYCQIYGISNGKRVFKWIRRDYLIISDKNTNFDKYKIFLARAFGRSNLGNEAGQLISPLDIGEPNQGCTQTFMTVGAFNTRDEAENCFAYIKSKFARVMLGILKVTPINPPSTWAKVPLQDFSSASDIDWHGDVDGQLYRKYNLSDAEINCIESHVKAMA